MGTVFEGIMITWKLMKRPEEKWSGKIGWKRCPERRWRRRRRRKLNDVDTLKQIVSTFIKHSLQEINITKLFPPKLAYFFFQSMHNCQSTGSIQTALFSWRFFWRPLNIKYVQKVRIDASKTKISLISLWSVLSFVPTSQIFKIVNTMQKETMILQLNHSLH